MNPADAVGGGQPPAPHRGGAWRLLGIAVLGSLSCVLLFGSGFLIGNRAESSPSAAPEQDSVSQGLPAAPAADSEPKPTPKEKQQATTTRVKVRAGDSLFRIATRVAPDADPVDIVDKIVKLNGLSTPDAIEIGQRLIVPVRSGDRIRTEPVRSGDRIRTEPLPAPARAATPQPSVQPADNAPIPTQVSIPVLDLQRNLVNLDVIGGTLQVPQRWNDVGWWANGPRPGEPGASVLVGHVDSPTGPAVFYGLSALKVGDVITMQRVDSSKITYRVVRSALYPRSDFPSEKIYRDYGPSVLNLITCGGQYDDKGGLYTENLVVTAALVQKANG